MAQNLVAQVVDFKQECEKEPPNYEAAKAKLSQLKIGFTKLPGFLVRGAVAPSPDQILLVRDTLEHAALLAVRVKDFASFDANVAQLKTYYAEYRGILPDSQKELMVLGLNLLRQLTVHAIARFHAELELIESDTARNSVWIRHPIMLEQFLMEGSYNRVWASRDDVPHALYAVFVDQLMETVREEFAECAEKAYERLSVREARKLLLFNTDDELAQFAAKRSWHIASGEIVFARDKAEQLTVPARAIIKETLEYAKELERII